MLMGIGEEAPSSMGGKVPMKSHFQIVIIIPYYTLDRVQPSSLSQTYHSEYGQLSDCTLEL